jgi:hypothetical protein
MVAVPDAVKAVLILRCMARCEACGEATGLDPHHRRGRGMGGVSGEAEQVSLELSNFLALCRRCHDRADAEPEFARSRGWVVPRALPVEAVHVPAFIWTTQGRGWWWVGPPGIEDGFQWFDALTLEGKAYLEDLDLDWAGTAGANALVRLDF